jgi:HlyD family secretion protein
VPEPEREALARSLKRHGWGTALLVLLLFAGCGSWAALAEIAGAVVAAGKIAVESSAKRVQHQDGGIVAEIQVREGMEVAAVTCWCGSTTLWPEPRPGSSPSG